jgi:glycosidase
MLLRIRLVTTSDWTDLRLISGATALRHDQVSASDEATTAEVRDNQFVLDQPIARAEAGGSAEMVVETLFSGWESGRTVVFEIDRGHIGYTQVEFSRYVEDAWVLIRTIRWDGIIADGRNALSSEIPAEELFGEAPLSTVGRTPGATPVAPVTGMPQGTDGYPWWNDSVFYEIFVRSFSDSDGDGIGDLIGITQNLDYLNDGDPATSMDLGITGIWLMPIFPSPSYHGYNVTDYYGVNPDYGTMDDLRDLLAAAHARGIRVILDISLGQTSSEHPWFIQAGNPASPYHDWYIWSDEDPGYSGSWGQQVWFPLNGRYYYGTFSAWSPDLNLRNPEVNAELQEVVRFWLEEVGVDGFRLDSAKHLIEEGTIQANSASTHAWWERFRPFYKQINPQAMTVAEIWDEPHINAEYIQGDEVDLAFEFYLADAFVHAPNLGNAETVIQQLELAYSLIPPLQFAPFLTNHDQDRLMTQLGGDPDMVRMAASLLLTSPGVPFLYYGEEIGMQGEKPDEQIRRPMQWSAERFAGFSSGTPWEPLGPGWETFHVAGETDDPASILSHYRALIQARNQHAALRVGDLSVVSTGNDALYSILRVSREEAVLVLINLTGEAVMDCRLALEESSLAEGSYMPAAILGEGVFAPLSVDSSGGFSQYVPVPEIPPYATFILQLQLNAGVP